MAAPSNTKWGSIVGGYGRIGISVTLTNLSSTQTKRHTEVWFWSKYSVSDSSNTFYYNDNASTATTSRGSRTLKTTVDSGGGWSTSNQQKISEADYTYTRGTSNKTYNVAVKLTGVERVGGTMTCVHSYTIPAKPSYTVTFVNGYGDTIRTQTVYHGNNASPPANPSRTGYTFAGWSGTYTNVTSNRTITATWSIWKYTITYNANGGSGAPAAQTKNYGTNITLSTTKPTRANYNFLGWATSPSGGVAYNPGSTYSANANVTLYAVWQLAYQKPRISGFSVQRCNSSGTASESGTCGKVSFNWATDRAVTAVYVQWRAQNSSSWSSLSIGGASTTVSNKVFGNNGLSAETSYIVRVYVSDSGGTTYSSELSLGTIKYPIDVKAGGTGVAFGKVAESANLFDVGWLARFRNGFKGDWISEPMAGGDAREIIHVPYLTYGDFGSSTETDNYFKEWLKWICKNYPGKTGAIFIGAVCPNSQGTAICYIYDTNNVSNGLPQYSGGLYIYLNSGGLYFGTSSYNYSYRYHADISWSSIQGKPSTFPPSSHSHNYLNKDGDTVNGRGSLYYLSSNVEIGCGSSGYTNNAYVQAYNGYCSIRSHSQSVYNNGAYIDSNWSHGKFYPQNSGQALGTSAASNRWYRLYAATACNTSSDRRLKKDIAYFDEMPAMYSTGGNVFEEFFNKLKGTTFVAKDDEFNRIKFGFIAQDVIEALEAVGLTAYDVDFVSHGRDENDKISEDAMYGLCYEEFIALNTHMIQKAHRKIDEQQIKIEQQQKEIDDLKSQVQELKDLVLNLSKTS